MASSDPAEGMASSDPAEGSGPDTLEKRVERMIELLDNWTLKNIELVEAKQLPVMDVTVCCSGHHTLYLRILTTSVTQKTMSADDVDLVGSQMCAVCRTEYRIDDETRTLPACGHMFHEHCLWGSLTRRLNCPYCRAEVDPKLVKIEMVRSVPCDRGSFDPTAERILLNRAIADFLQGHGQQEAN